MDAANSSPSNAPASKPSVVFKRSALTFRAGVLIKPNNDGLIPASSASAVSSQPAPIPTPQPILSAPISASSSSSVSGNELAAAMFLKTGPPNAIMPRPEQTQQQNQKQSRDKKPKHKQKQKKFENKKHENAENQSLPHQAEASSSSPHSIASSPALSTSSSTSSLGLIDPSQVPSKSKRRKMIDEYQSKGKKSTKDSHNEEKQKEANFTALVAQLASEAVLAPAPAAASSSSSSAPASQHKGPLARKRKLATLSAAPGILPTPPLPPAPPQQKAEKLASRAKPREREERPKPDCIFWLKGKCSKGLDCMFSHEKPISKQSEICKFYKSGNCIRGAEHCPYSHDTKNIPCTYMAVRGFCEKKDTCIYSHEPVNAEQREAIFEELKKRKEEQAKIDADLAAGKLPTLRAGAGLRRNKNQVISAEQLVVSSVAEKPFSATIGLFAGSSSSSSSAVVAESIEEVDENEEERDEFESLFQFLDGSESEDTESHKKQKQEESADSPYHVPPSLLPQKATPTPTPASSSSIHLVGYSLPPSLPSSSILAGKQPNLVVKAVNAADTASLLSSIIGSNKNT